MACHTAIVTETVAIWSKSMTELNTTRTTPNPVILETLLAPCQGQACKGQTKIQGPTASTSLGQLPSPLEAGTKQPPSLADPFVPLPFVFPFPSITDGGGSCQNKLGQASQPENTNCLNVFACLLAPLWVAHFSFYSCRIFPLGTQGLWGVETVSGTPAKPLGKSRHFMCIFLLEYNCFTMLVSAIQRRELV